MVSKGISEEKDPADAFEKGWLIASATVLMRAHVVKPRLPEKLRSYQEEKFFFRDERNMPFEEGMFKKEGVLGMAVLKNDAVVPCLLNLFFLICATLLLL